MDIRTEIRRCRQAAGMTMAELADAADLSEVFIRKIETGRKDPTLRTLRTLARIFREKSAPFQEPLEQMLGESPIESAA
jgi:transcriptional regulator with XRE-family HTH domain